MPYLVMSQNYYSTQWAIAQGTTSAVGDAWGFPASVLRFLNTEAADFYVRLNSTTAASTADMRVRACSEFALSGLPPVVGLTVYTTSTSASAKLLGVTALGG